MNKYPLMKGPGFFKRNFSFSGHMTAGEFWSDLGIRLIELLCAAILVCILVAVLVPGTTEELVTVSNIAVSVPTVFWFASTAAKTRRRLRDGGYTAKAYLWLLLPGIGTIVFIARLCAKSVPEETKKPTRY